MTQKQNIDRAYVYNETEYNSISNYYSTIFVNKKLDVFRYYGLWFMLFLQCIICVGYIMDKV